MNAFDYLMLSLQHHTNKNIHKIPLPWKRHWWMVYTVFNPVTMLLFRIMTVMENNKGQWVAHVKVILICVRCNSLAIIYTESRPFTFAIDEQYWLHRIPVNTLRREKIALHHAHCYIRHLEYIVLPNPNLLAKEASIGSWMTPVAAWWSKWS